MGDITNNDIIYNWFLLIQLDQVPINKNGHSCAEYFNFTVIYVKLTTVYKLEMVPKHLAILSTA
jgi:hypothetical protein